MEDERTLRMEEKQEGAAGALRRSAALMARLRAPGGCPWDREQTFDSIKPFTLEETYEVFDAIERRAWPELRDELGDLLLQVLFYAQMAEDAGHFKLQDVAEALNAKLIRRHPHVFPPSEDAGAAHEPASSPDAVLRNWERVKQMEKQSRPAETGEISGATKTSLLDEISRHMPAALEATKLGSRAAKVGFDWPDANGLFLKLAEETSELRSEVVVGDRARMEEEFGDLLFTMMNLGRHLRVDAESALRGSNAKFRRRFAAMEQEVGGADALARMSAEELERLWSVAKSATDRFAGAFTEIGSGEITGNGERSSAEKPA